VYILVDSVAATMEAVVANSGEIVPPIGADALEITARFRDPGGNVLGLYPKPAKQGKSRGLQNRKKKQIPRFARDDRGLVLTTEWRQDARVEVLRSAQDDKGLCVEVNTIESLRGNTARRAHQRRITLT
jgi:hypothetical protein